MEEFYEQNMEFPELQNQTPETQEEAMRKAEADGLHMYGRECDCMDYCSHEETLDLPVACSDVFYQTDLVSVPIRVTPFARAGHCTTACCGSPVVTSGNACQGDIDQSCEFTVTQKICVKLPLHFGASVKIDQAKVQCGSVAETECDCKNPCIRKCD